MSSAHHAASKRSGGWAIWIGAASVGAACVSAPIPSPAKSESSSAPVVAGAAKTTKLAVSLPNAHRPLPDVLTGGAPSAAQLQEAKNAGYKTVISLLPVADSAEEAAQARSLGLRFFSIPVAGADDLTEENARTLADYMDAPGIKPLILHCTSANRAGALLALRAHFVDQQPAEAALRLGESAGMTTLRPAVEARMHAGQD